CALAPRAVTAARPAAPEVGRPASWWLFLSALRFLWRCGEAVPPQYLHFLRTLAWQSATTLGLVGRWGRACSKENRMKKQLVAGALIFAVSSGLALAQGEGQSRPQ